MGGWVCAYVYRSDRDLFGMGCSVSESALNAVREAAHASRENQDGRSMPNVFDVFVNVRIRSLWNQCSAVSLHLRFSGGS